MEPLTELGYPMSENPSESSDHIDEAIVNELEALLEDDFVDLIETFLSDARVRYRELEDTVASTVAEDIRRAAHSFKGSSLNVGATRLSSLCKQLEDHARDGRTVYAKDLLANINEEMLTVDSLFRARYLDA